MTHPTNSARWRGALGALALAMAGATPAAPQWLLVNGKVFTADEARPYASALAVEDGRISAVGTDDAIRALAGPGTRILDVGGRLVTPGLTEAHVHLGAMLPTPPLAMPGLPFPGPTSDQAVAAVERAVQSAPPSGAWISAYIGPLVARDTRNWRKALDAVAPNTPVFLRGFWGHTSIVNTAGLRRLGISEDVADPLGGWWGRDAQGRLDGRAYEGAETLNARIAQLDAPRLAETFADAGRRYARWGVTAIHLMNNDRSVALTMAALGIGKPLQKWVVYSWGAWQTPVDRLAAAWSVIDAVGPSALPKVRVEGPKWILDGTPIEQLALERTAYEGRPSWFGHSNFTDAQLREILTLALARPTQLAMHAVGDAETERLLTTMETLAPAAAWRTKRVRIEHGDGIRPDLVARAVRLGVVVIQNPFHLETAPGGVKIVDP